MDYILQWLITTFSIGVFMFSVWNLIESKTVLNKALEEQYDVFKEYIKTVCSTSEWIDYLIGCGYSEQYSKDNAENIKTAYLNNVGLKLEDINMSLKTFKKNREKLINCMLTSRETVIQNSLER